MFLPLLLLVIFGYVSTSLRVAASYQHVTPPDSVRLTYPTSDVVLNSAVTLDFAGGEEDIKRSYYGFAAERSIYITYPNNTQFLLYATGTLRSAAHFNCSRSPGHIHGHAHGQPQTDVAGKYTVVWNVTYGTTDDPSIANQSFCDVSRLSYQTWLFNTSYDVVEPQSSNENQVSQNQTVTMTLQPEPTGKIFESNRADSKVRVGVKSVMGVVALALFLSL